MDHDWASVIAEAVAKSKLEGYKGTFHELGGGEVNDTFVLDCGPEPVVLRTSHHINSRGLKKESEALALMNFDRVPKLIFFDVEKRINDRLWILESFIPGKMVERLNTTQYRSLGELLAKVHSIKEEKVTPINLWEHFLEVSEHFGTEQSLLHHPYKKLNQLINKAHDYCARKQPLFARTKKSLTHGDATPSNVLVNNHETALIDWEFSRFQDPMLDFSTIYYDDMSYNLGKWRVHITAAEKEALYSGYEKAGGELDTARIDVWMNIDKLGAAVYLYWKVYESLHVVEAEKLNQYLFDFDDLLLSLEKNLT